MASLIQLEITTERLSKQLKRLMLFSFMLLTEKEIKVLKRIKLNDFKSGDLSEYLTAKGLIGIGLLTDKGLKLTTLGQAVAELI